MLKKTRGINTKKAKYIAKFLIYYYYYYYYNCIKQYKKLFFHFYKSPFCKNQKQKLVNNFLKICN